MKYLLLLFFISTGVFSDSLKEQNKKMIQNLSPEKGVFLAIELKDYEELNKILASYPNLVNSKNENDSYPIHITASLNDRQSLEILKSFGVEINAVDRNSETALDIVKANNFQELEKYLVNLGGISKKVYKSNITIWLYSIYLLISLILTIWVARTLSKNGIIFIIDVFKGNSELAASVNHLLVVGFYLINFGFVTLALHTGMKPTSYVEVIELLSSKIGYVILVLGFMHFFNLFIFANLRKKAFSKKHEQVSVDVIRPTA